MCVLEPERLQDQVWEPLFLNVLFHLNCSKMPLFNFYIMSLAMIIVVLERWVNIAGGSLPKTINPTNHLVNKPFLSCWVYQGWEMCWAGLPGAWLGTTVLKCSPLFILY